jgi:hypothetical protein
MVIFDELAFWADESAANPDVEIALAVAPGLARIKNSMLVMISSAHRRAGLLYSRWAKYFGKENDDDILVVRGTTVDFNPGFDRKTIQRSLDQDREKFGAEYLSEWRDDLSAFITRDLLEKLVDRNVIVRPPQPNLHYICGFDASGGRNDSATAAISHRMPDGAIILDLLYEKKSPFDPQAMVADVVALMNQYRVNQITGDGYAASWVSSAFVKAGKCYIRSTIDRSGVYLNALPLFTSGQVRLLDSPKLINQFAALERRVFPTGRESVIPGPGHDDLANAAAISLSISGLQAPPLVPTMPFEVSRERSVSIASYSNHPCEAPQFENPAAPSRPEYSIGSGGGDLAMQGSLLRKLGLVR